MPAQRFGRLADQGSLGLQIQLHRLRPPASLGAARVQVVGQVCTTAARISLWVRPGAVAGRTFHMACRIASYIARLTRVVLPGTFTFSIRILVSLRSKMPPVTA